MNLRGAASTGFRAPSIHQLYYTNINTLQINGVLQETGTFNNISRAAELFGIDKLREEKSKSVSAGFALKVPKAGLSLSADAYFIRVDDRIILTEAFSRPAGNTTAENELKQITTGCPSGEVQTFLRLGQYENAWAAAAEFRDIFGEGNFYVELMDHGLSIENKVRRDLLRIAKDLNLPLVATNDLHYVHAAH